MAAEDYVGPPGKEKKFHKTHFQMMCAIKNRTHPKDDPQWEEFAPGRWRKKRIEHAKSKR
mgnify:CR=1 FL=1